MFIPPLGRPAIMGILNVTPDSFSDGGQFYQREAAIAAGMAMRDAGADIIDVGGESTRPGALPVSQVEEVNRVIPVIEALAGQGVPISVDTSKAEVARLALQAGAVVVNDVTALSDPGMKGVIQASKASLCLMHMKGEPRTMQASPTYDDVVDEVGRFLLNAASHVSFGRQPSDRVWLDPGIGFGKTIVHNVALCMNISRFVGTGYPILLGVSRKSFLGKLLEAGGEQDSRAGRVKLGLSLQSFACREGVRGLRVHDVPATVKMVERFNAGADDSAEWLKATAVFNSGPV